MIELHGLHGIMIRKLKSGINTVKIFFWEKIYPHCIPHSLLHSTQYFVVTYRHSISSPSTQPYGRPVPPESCGVKCDAASTTLLLVPLGSCTH